jgi:hypothetical protein
VVKKCGENLQQCRKISRIKKIKTRKIPKYLPNFFPKKDQICQKKKTRDLGLLRSCIERDVVGMNADG